MALRLVQMVCPGGAQTDLDDLLEGREILGTWRDTRAIELIVVHLLVPAEETEPILDRFEQRFFGLQGFHVVLFPIEAVLPRPPAPETAPAPLEEPAEAKAKSHRVSREELHAEAVDASSATRVFLALTALSAVVAIIGLRRNDVAVIIGAMVIAPLLGPNVALALATTLADGSLAKRALRTSALGLLIALPIAVFAGWVWGVDPHGPAIAGRTWLGYDDLLLALAAGAAGTFAFTSGIPSAAIGVMVAVALLPPLVTFGLLLGAGYAKLALGAGLLVAANVICVNLAGVATFLAQGVKPRDWWKAEQAKKATWRAVALWVILLVALIVVLIIAQPPLPVRQS